MNALVDFFGCGSVNIITAKNGVQHAVFTVFDIAGLETIRQHFLSYPLQSYKYIHFVLWSKA